MTAFLERESASDLDLISAARDGDDEAVAELYVRHHEAAVRYGRGLADPTTAEDLAAEAFAKLLERIRTGGGPETAFRPYLLRTVHNVYVNHVRRDSRHSWVEDADDLDLPLPVDVVEERRESSVLATAFESLPERWQTVLWHTAVEGDDHETVGRLLGLKANAVAALAFRSREGLRSAYLEAHLGAARDEACRPYREDLASYARARLRGRRRERLEQHLAQCPDCTAGYLELSALGTNLGAVLAPAVLGTAAAVYAGGAAGAGGAVGLFDRRITHTALAAVVAVVAVVAMAVAGLAYVAQGGGPDSAAAAEDTEGLRPGGTGGAPDPGTTTSTASPEASPKVSTSPAAVAFAPSPMTTPSSSMTRPVVVPTSTPRPSQEPTEKPSPTSTPNATPPVTPTVMPTVPPTVVPTVTPTVVPTATPTADPKTQDDLALGSGSHTYYGPHHHLQMSVAALLDSTVITIDVRGLTSFDVHDEPSYLPATCTQTGVDGDLTRLTCQLAPGTGTFSIDVVVTGQLDVTARISAVDNEDPVPANDVLAFQS